MKCFCNKKSKINIDCFRNEFIEIQYVCTKCDINLINIYLTNNKIIYFMFFLNDIFGFYFSTIESIQFQNDILLDVNQIKHIFNKYDSMNEIKQLYYDYILFI